MLSLVQIISIVLIYLFLLAVILPVYAMVDRNLIESQILESGNESKKMVDRINSILRGSDVFVWRINAEGMFSADDELMDLYGLKHDWVPLQIVLASLTRKDRRKLNEALNSSEDSRFEIHATERGQIEGHDFSVTMCHEVSEDGTVTHYGTMVLLDRKKRVDEEMRDAVEMDLQASAKTSVLASMGHEIRTPLNVIVGFSKLLVENRNEMSMEECEEYYKIIEQNNSQLLNLLDSVFSVSGEGEDGLKITLSRKNVSDVMEDLYMAHTVIVPDTLRFRFIRGNDDDYFMINRGSLLQIVSNLMNNAVKFTEEGTITLGWTSDDENVTIFVEDTGIGVPAESRERIFDKYYKENTSSVGAGIGLPLCRKLVHEMNGSIMVADSEGPGSRFEVIIPKLK